ncbi:UDP-glucose--hexose-1-phosphate uridylyltransferase [Halobacillus salinarum]|uniref:Galactose-1-phosphate uridylyltransferase n=1 Tax=Halobacillus salinarum TaxID=2932257 RepID=A0ABY4EPV0_9BACI|nr:UDP-glucose--hexose-1-phosphate uridylyltransferase [Halobacillus salinarum]UOQ45662.1 UDP-glucose--hexose-1-phosphate uridylyltransferase [Halobacillus salinarum]
MNEYHEIERLIQYGLQKNLIAVWDVDYTRNALFRVLGLEGEEPSLPLPVEQLENPTPVLEKLLDYAVDKGFIDDNTTTQRDLFDPKLMDCLVPRPSYIIRNFYEKYETHGPEAATHYFYQLSKDTDYIRTERIAKNVHWYSETEYGNLEITINLSKPEKDPKAIAAEKANTSVNYPLCLLCKENVGYSGRMDHPARDNHRIIPVDLEGEHWFLQYSPYVYYNEHAIVFSREHRPMEISKAGFKRLLHFTEQLPHYFVGSNADLPIVGGSILSHDHFQGGHHEFPMAKAPVEHTFTIQDFEDIEAGIVKWPMSVIRIKGKDRDRLSELGERILQTWKQYSDEPAGIEAFSNEEPHNTITPIARMRGGEFEMDLVLRNNRTNSDHPLGIFHPHEDVHHIKKENIGLIEVMGLAVLPGRLVKEMEALAEYILNGELFTKALEDEGAAKHVPWAKEIVITHGSFTEEELHRTLRQEIGKTFSTVLEHAGVFKRTDSGREAFLRFIDRLHTTKEKN